MERVTAVLLSVCVIAALLALVGIGWRARLKRQREFGELPPVPQVLSPSALTVDGQYVVTTTEGDWLDRIAVHSLGVKSNAVLSIHAQGVLLRRTGARDVFVPVSGLTRVRTESGMAGKFVEKDGLVVLSWNLAGHGVDTAFRTRAATEKKPLVTALTELLPTEPHDGDIKDRQ